MMKKIYGWFYYVCYPLYIQLLEILFCIIVTLLLEKVFDALYSKEKMKQLVIGSKAQAEDLVVWERIQKRNFGGDARGILKSSNKDKTCRYCKRKGHIKSECYKLQNKNKKVAANQQGKQLEESGEANVVEDEYSDGKILVFFFFMATPNLARIWFLILVAHFMCPNWDYFSTYETMSKCVV